VAKTEQGIADRLKGVLALATRNVELSVTIDNGAGQVIDAIEGVASVSEETAASAQELSAGAQEVSVAALRLREMATELREKVSSFSASDDSTTMLRAA